MNGYGRLLALAVGLAVCMAVTALMVGRHHLGLVAEPPRALPSAGGSDPGQPPFADISRTVGGKRGVVVMYHDVVSEPQKNGVYFDTTLKEFKQNLDDIEASGAQVVSLRDLYDALTGQRPLDRPSVVLTFDDGYEGFYANVFPVLRERNLPATVFMHTAYIGSKTGRPKMTLEQLKEIEASGLVDVESHTVTHPEDITALPPDKVRQELTQSKGDLEKKLGKTVDFLSWPVGKNDASTQEEARVDGYKMAVTMEPGLAHDSPNILAVDRITPRRLGEYLQTLASLPDVGRVEATWSDTPVTLRVSGDRLTDMLTVTGGRPSSVLIQGRDSVANIVNQFGGVAGINGGFFTMAAIAATDNKMIGPCLVSNLHETLSDEDKARLAKLAERPFVVWNESKMVIVPFAPLAMDDRAGIDAVLPDATDAFVAGAWLVYQGRALSAEEMMGAATSDAQDPRKRGFIGLTEDGRLIIGASRNSIRSSDLAEAALQAGAYNAVLLDSGFSTSLVIGGRTLAWGHRSATGGSRPVPHAIVVKGTLDPTLDTSKLESVEQAKPEPRRRHRRR